jgi:glutamyl-Q tRNA(Asp) synthetase
VPYVGRFAPSPTGPLHLGSLTTAVASYLEARTRGGRWLLRIEDVDSTRTVAGAADEILHTLTSLGFEWDGPVIYQCQRTSTYLAALARLQLSGQIYECGCTRSMLAESGAAGGYPGTCRAGAQGIAPYALRLRVDETASEQIEDGVRGHCSFDLRTLGDPVLRRRDGLIAYQLAVVVDDAEAGITHIVRGADLLESTAWQRCLQRALGLPTPLYTHVPLVMDADGAKLSKSRQAVTPNASRAEPWLYQALQLLRQQPPAALRFAPASQIWQWATHNWHLEHLGLSPILYYSQRGE